MSKKSTVIYDGQCNFCKRWIGRLRKADTEHRFEMVPNDRPGLLNSYPMLKGKDVNKSVWLVTEDNKLYGGSDAAYQILKRLKGYRVFAPFYKLPFARRIAMKAYDFISAHRDRL
jgi:predicted DCC family thiol-disulfide oxidoreductase YuxK